MRYGNKQTGSHDGYRKQSDGDVFFDAAANVYPLAVSLVAGSLVLASIAYGIIQKGMAMVGGGAFSPLPLYEQIQRN